MFPAEFEKFVWEGIIFLAFALSCACLAEHRGSRAAAAAAGAGALAVVAGIQAALLLAGEDPTLVLTLLPLTAYLPAILALHLISRSGFSQTMAVWTVGIMVSFVLNSTLKILSLAYGRFSQLPGWQFELGTTALLALLAAALVFLVFRFLREPFRTYVLRNQTGWLLLCFPVLMVFLLLSYFSSTTTNVTALVLLTLTAVSIFLVLVRVLVLAVSMRKMEETEREVSRQLELQRREYERARDRLRQGRAYRHDMRHHLLVLEELARQENAEDILDYIESLSGQLSQIAGENYCENAAVNAVLSACVGQAREAGCSVTAEVRLPGQLPFDKLDICVVLANALENAVHACGKVEKERRQIRADVELDEAGKLRILVTNPCPEPLKFDDEGLPAVPRREGHGIGLRSIRAVAEKYGGLFRCSQEEGMFRLQVALFRREREGDPGARQARGPEGKPRRARRAAAVTALLLFALVFALGCMPAMADELAQVPGLGALVRLADIRTYTAAFSWGDSSFEAQVPVVEGGEDGGPQRPEDEVPEGPAAGGEDPAGPEEPEPSAPPDSVEDPDPEPSAPAEDPEPSVPAEEPAPEPSGEPVPEPTPEPTPDTPGEGNGEEEMNQEIQDYLARMEEVFWWYVARKYNGYVGQDTTYQVLRNDGRLLSIRFDTTLNVGGSVQYSRCITLDKQRDAVLELADLFAPGSDYVAVISGEILAQMTQQVEAGLADYFIPGGIWSDEECFQSIAEDQNFYLDGDGRLVIVFDEYEVAPGSMGMPEFTIPTGILSGILAQDSPLGTEGDEP